MSSEKDNAKKLLRSFLNSRIKGKGTNSLLQSMSPGAADLIHNARAVSDNLFIMSAEGRFLDRLIADRNISRPGEVGLSDEDFREIGVQVSNRKQVRDLISKILDITYGYEYARAFSLSFAPEPYSLSDGDTLRVRFDDNNEFNIPFKSDNFQNISSAKAREVADSITRYLKSRGFSGFADVKDDGTGAYVSLFSPTSGPSSSVTVIGGKAQNSLNFQERRYTSQQAGTELTLSYGESGSIRATWTGGPSPSFGRVSVGDYANIFGSPFSSSGNSGTYQVVALSGGSLGDAYVEWTNPSGVIDSNPSNNVITLSGENDIAFFFPKRVSLISKPSYAAVYQTQDRVLEIYLPALTRVVRRDRIDASYVFDGPAPVGAEEQWGNYIYDTTVPYTIGGQYTALTADISPSLKGILPVANSSDFPSSGGYLVFGLGTDREEGPVQYISVPSSNSIAIAPSYSFKYAHRTGTEITFAHSNSSFTPDPSGSDYQTYMTDVASGRRYVQELIDLVTAAGINLVFTVLYPGPEGLENWYKESEEAKTQWQEVFD